MEKNFPEGQKKTKILTLTLESTYIEAACFVNFTYYSLFLQLSDKILVLKIMGHFLDIPMKEKIN